MTNMPHDLTLESRPGLPDELAYLRAAYPKEKWQEHRNYGGLSAFWLQIHASLRDEGRHLSELTTAFREGRLDAGAFQHSFLRRLNQFLQHLNGHHRIEDDFYFPEFRELDQGLVAGFDLLEADHEHIHEALLASASSGSALLTSLGHGPDATQGAADTHGTDTERLLKLLVRHLADEEDLIVPAMLHHGKRPVT